jgi:hypothetical protein
MIKIPTLEQRQNKIEICIKCEEWIPNQDTISGTCKLCGCDLSVENLSAKKCPKNLWVGWE